MKKDIIEINWINADCIPVIVLNELNSFDTILVERANGEIILCKFCYSDDYIHGYQNDFFYDNTYYIGDKEISEEDAKKFVTDSEFVMYESEMHTSYGEYIGSEITFYDDIVRIALIPKTPVLNAMMQYRRDYI